MLNNQPWLSSEDKPSNRLHRMKSRKELTPIAVQAVVRNFSAWNIPPRLAARLLDVDEGTWSAMVYGSWKGTLSVDQLERSSIIAAIDRELKKAFEERVANNWLSIGHQELPFRGRRPIDLMAIGGLSAFQTVRKYLKLMRRELAH